MKSWWSKEQEKILFAVITLAKKCDLLSTLSNNVPLFSAGK